MRRPKQFKLPIPNSHGGKRKNAGRHNQSGQRAHTRRPRLDVRFPVHAALKIRAGLPSLRCKEALAFLRHAVFLARKKGLRIVHFAILSNHVHLIIEPCSSCLAPCMQSFCVSFAKQINRRVRRTGPVFQDRYHLHLLRTPSEVRRALAYILTNESRHRHPESKVHSVEFNPYSSALLFEAWQALFGAGGVTLSWGPWNAQDLFEWIHEWVTPASTWLLRLGWLRA